MLQISASVVPRGYLAGKGYFPGVLTWDRRCHKRQEGGYLSGSLERFGSIDSNNNPTSLLTKIPYPLRVGTRTPKA